jgi:hypothetical protein
MSGLPIGQWFRSFVIGCTDRRLQKGADELGRGEFLETTRICPRKGIDARWAAGYF